MEQINHVKITDFFQRKEKIDTFKDSELILFHCFVHQVAHNKKIKKVNNVHENIVAEMTKRKLMHIKFDELDGVDKK